MGKFSSSIVISSKQWLISGIKVQLLTSALSLPILVAWGLPISIMGIGGNLLATPFLMASLMLSSLIFLTEIFHLPNFLLYPAIEYITSFWHYLLSFGSNTWLIGFNAPPISLSIMMSFIIAVGMWYSVHRYKFSIILASIMAMAISLGVFSLYHYKSIHVFEKISCIKRNNQKLVIDYGFFAHKTSYKSPARYQIKPLLYKNFGTNHIQRWHCTYGGTRSLKALNTLLEEIKIDAITFGVLPKKQNSAWQEAWQALDNKTKQLGIKMDKNQTDPYKILLKKSSKEISPKIKL